MGKFIISFMSICFEMFIACLLFYVLGTTMGNISEQQQFYNTLILFFGSAFDITLFLYTLAHIFKNAFLIKEKVMMSTNAYVTQDKTTDK